MFSPCYCSEPSRAEPSRAEAKRVHRAGGSDRDELGPGKDRDSLGLVVVLLIRIRTGPGPSHPSLSCPLSGPQQLTSQQPMAFIGHWVKDQSELGCCTETLMWRGGGGGGVLTWRNAPDESLLLLLLFFSVTEVTYYFGRSTLLEVKILY